MRDHYHDRNDIVKQAKVNLNKFMDFPLPLQSKDIEDVYKYLYKKSLSKKGVFDEAN